MRTSLRSLSLSYAFFTAATFNGTLKAYKSGAAVGGTVYPQINYTLVNSRNNAVASGTVATVRIANNETATLGVYSRQMNFGYLDAGTYRLYVTYSNTTYQGQSVSIICQDLSFSCSYRLSEFVIPKTVVGVDGLLTIKDAGHYFAVDNSGDEQQIIAKGLKTQKSTDMTDGELYVSDNLLTAFDKLISTLKTIVESVRSVGNNAENAQKWKDDLDTVYSLIQDSGIVAEN